MARKPIREPCHHMVATTKVTTKHHQIVFFANAKKRKAVQIARTEQIFHLNLSRYPSTFHSFYSPCSLVLHSPFVGMACSKAFFSFPRWLWRWMALTPKDGWAPADSPSLSRPRPSWEARRPLTACLALKPTTIWSDVLKRYWFHPLLKCLESWESRPNWNIGRNTEGISYTLGKL